MTGPAGAPRRAELAAGLAEVEARLGAACSAAGRPRSDVLLLAVTKTWPASDVALLHDLGLRAFGENREPEAGRKAAELADLPDVGWHWVGQLQTNKARSVAAWADVVHSVDRPALVAALDRGAERAERVLEVLLQVDLSGDPGASAGGAGRGGCAPQDVPALAAAVAGCSCLRLRGVMAVAPRGQDPAPSFARLARVAERLRAEHPGAREISAGMSGDLEQAVAAGTTIVRVGTALLGRRPAPTL